MFTEIPFGPVTVISDQAPRASRPTTTTSSPAARPLAPVPTAATSGPISSSLNIPLLAEHEHEENPRIPVPGVGCCPRVGHASPGRLPQLPDRVGPRTWAGYEYHWKYCLPQAHRLAGIVQLDRKSTRLKPSHPNTP